MKYFRLLLFYLHNLFIIPRAVKLRDSNLFSTAYYAEQYDDIHQTYLFPEIHFLRHGMYELRNPHPLFDTRFYTNQVPSFFSLKVDPISHFINVGASKGFNPHPLFNVKYYIQSCPSNNIGNPLVHYLMSKPEERGEPNPLFFNTDYEKYNNDSRTNDIPLLDYLGAVNNKVQTFSLESLEQVNNSQRFKCYIERFSTFYGALFVYGWAFCHGKSITRIGHLNSKGSVNWFKWIGLPSEDIVERFGSDAENCRFELKLNSDLPSNHLDVVIVFQFADGTVAYEYNIDRYGLEERPHTYFIDKKFTKMLRDDSSSAKILEIGSRDRSKFVSKDVFVPSWFNYTGIDILEGDNVDIVCDAHELSKYFSTNEFDYIFSINVFEHLLIPWKVVLEINKILKVGGKVMIFTHQTMPLHDEPTDYWRFSDKAWPALFCRETGFSITYTGMGDPVSVVPQKTHLGSYNLSLAPAFIHSMVIAEKIADSTVSWDVDMNPNKDIYPDTYG